MAITEEQYEQITDELDSYDFSRLGEIAAAAGMPALFQEFDELHEHARRALDYAFDESTEQSLETLFEDVDELHSMITGALVALEHIAEVLSKAEMVLSNALYADDFE